MDASGASLKEIHDIILSRVPNAEDILAAERNIELRELDPNTTALQTRVAFGKDLMPSASYVDGEGLVLATASTRAVAAKPSPTPSSPS